MSLYRCGIYARVCTDMYVGIFMRVCVCFRPATFCLCVCVCVIYIYIHTYTHYGTYIHTRKHTHIHELQDGTIILRLQLQVSDDPKVELISPGSDVPEDPEYRAPNVCYPIGYVSVVEYEGMKWRNEVEYCLFVLFLCDPLREFV